MMSSSQPTIYLFNLAFEFFSKLHSTYSLFANSFFNRTHSEKIFYLFIYLFIYLFYLNQVIIGAPWSITRDLIVTFNISVVVHGSLSDSSMKIPDKPDDGPYKVAKEMGIFKLIESPSTLKVTSKTNKPQR